MDPIEFYHQAIISGQYRHDKAQLSVIDAFQEVYDSLVRAEKKSSNPFARTLKRLFSKKSGHVRGLYLWGDVGRGKTWLMNQFYACLPFDNKVRLHFHHFMLSVHERLSDLKNQKDPLKIMARDFASAYRVLCLDEFIVTNITDAMLLYGLLDALFENGVTLIATSNRVPDDLYLNGLQRARFLPAIELIKQNTSVVHLDSTIDHRLALLEQDDVYYTPISSDTNKVLGQRLQALATDNIRMGRSLTILNRVVPTIACATEIAWFDFNMLCDAPRAAQDYIQLANDFHTIILSDVPILDKYLDDKARRFIYLIDELYDNKVKLIMSAEAPPDELYKGDMLKFAFNRTSSRLIEMRSKEYLEKPHLSSQ